MLRQELVWAFRILKSCFFLLVLGIALFLAYGLPVSANGKPERLQGSIQPSNFPIFDPAALTPSVTATPTVSATATKTPTAATKTATASLASPGATASNTAPSSRTPTATGTATRTLTRTPTSTSTVARTPTNTPSVVRTPTPTVTLSLTRTPTPSVTRTPTPQSKRVGNDPFPFKNFIPLLSNDQPSAVRLAPSPSITDGMGIERFWTYQSFQLTDRLTLLVNLWNGNLVAQYNEFSIPSLGLPLALNQTLNSQVNLSGIAGFNWTRNLDYRVVSANRKATVYDPDGTQLQFTNPSQGVYAAPSGIFDTLQGVGSSSGPYTITHKDQSQHIFGLNNNGTWLVTKMQDRVGNALTLAYDASYRVITATAAGGQYLALNYAPSTGKLVTATNSAAAQSFTYQYVADDLTGITDPLGLTTSFTYTTHKLSTVTDPRNVQTVIQYDGSNHVQNITIGGTQVASFSYGTGTTTFTDGNNHATTYTINSTGQVTRMVDPLNGTTQYTLDANYNVTQVTDPLNRVTKATFDSKGNPLTQTDALTQTTTYTYNSTNDLLTVTDPLSRITRYGYDTVGNLKVITDALGFTTNYNYNSFGQRISSTDANSNLTAYEYTTGGYLITITDTVQNVTRYTYEAATGNRTAVVDALGNTTTFNYDSNNRVITTTAPLAGTQTAATIYGYDSVGNRTAITDALTHATRYNYDALNRQTAIIDPLTHSTNFGYDAVGNRTVITDANNHVTRYGYDALNRSVAITDALIHVTQYGYDAVGNRVAVTDARGNTTRYRYDNLNRVISTTIPITGTQTGTTLYGYDKVSNRTVITDANSNVTRYGYDGLNRTVAITDAALHVTRYDYDSVGNQKFITDSVNNTTRYDYDAINRVITTTNPQGKKQTVGYDAVGNVLTRTDELTRTTRYVYDKARRVVATTDTMTQTTQYGYDAVGNTIAITNPLTQTTSFGYDAANRMTSKTTPNGTTGYSYYNANNLYVLTNPSGATQTFTYDDANRLTREDDRDPLVTGIAGSHIVSTTTDIVDDPSNGGHAAWTNPGYARISDNSTATVVTNGESDYLKATNFGFSIPADASITGVSVNIEKWETYGCQIVDWVVKLVKGGVVSGNNKAIASYWPSGGTKVIYGGQDDLWGLTLIPSEVNASNFGVVVSVNDTACGTAYVNSILTTVFYTQSNVLNVSYVYGYDENGNRMSETESRLGKPDRVTSYTYNKANWLVTNTDAGGGVTIYGYDVAGNRTNISDALGVTTIITPTATNSLGSTSHSAGGAWVDTTANSYDPRNFLSQALTNETSGWGNLTFTTTLTYSPTNYLRTLTNASQGTYSGLSNYSMEYRDDNLLRRSRWDIPYGYDGANRITCFAPNNLVAAEFWGYYPDGNRLYHRHGYGLGSPPCTDDVIPGPAYGGRREDYYYTGQRLTQQVWGLYDINDTTTNTAVSNYSYDGAGDLTREVHVDYSNNTTTTLSYNWTWQTGAYRLTTFIAPNGDTTSFEYDSLGRISRRYTSLGYSDYIYVDGTDWLLRETWHSNVPPYNVFDLIRYWYTNGRPVRMELEYGNPVDLSFPVYYEILYLMYNWHGDVIYVDLGGIGAGEGQTAPWGSTDGARRGAPWDYYRWNTAWGYMTFTDLGLYYVHGRWYNPWTAMFLSPNEKGDYMYGGDGQDAVNWVWFSWGFNCQYYGDISLGTVEYQNPVQTYRCEDFSGNEFYVGRLVGRAASNTQATLEMIAGGLAIVGGGAGTPPSGGTLAVVLVGGGALELHGGLTLLRNALNPPTFTFAKGKSGQPSGSWKPSGPNWTQSEQLAKQRLGLTDHEFREAIHAIKRQIPGNPDMWFDLETGNVFDARSGELVGNLLDYR